MCSWRDVLTLLGSKGGCGRHFRFVTVSRERDTVEGMHVLEHFHEKGVHRIAPEAETKY